MTFPRWLIGFCLLQVVPTDPALIIAGAIGNVIDRLRFGHVVDFVDWYWGGYHWPAFNVADAAIVGGAIGLVLFSFNAPADAEGKG